jgi:Kef-type K+ transport system membrane component KefB
LIFSVSMALGAFLAGMVVGRSDYSLRAASEALPMRDAFAVLFFVSVGMLLDPGALIVSPGLVIGALGVVLVGKPLVALLLANSAEVTRAARALNPHIRVLARAPYLRDVPALKAAGANRVYSGEGEVALAFIEDIMDSLGATPEQIDRERARAHDELSGGV